MSRDIQTREDYATFVRDFALGINGLTHISTGPCPGCETCADTFGMDQAAFDHAMADDRIVNEPWFSWGACECCGGTLGGNREPMHGWTETDDILAHMNVCEDCAYFLEYGRLGDVVMERVGE